jgi:hypothetical protein
VLVDALGGEDSLELRDLVDGVDVIEALDAVAIALVDGVDAQAPPLTRTDPLALMRTDPPIAQQSEAAVGEGGCCPETRETVIWPGPV